MELVLTHAMAKGDPNRALIQRMAAGDQDALRALYAAYSRRVYAYAMRLTNNRAVAEEVLQDCLLAAWQGARRFRGESRVITWLLGIAHRQALNATRRKRLPSGGLDQAATLADGATGPEAHTEGAERRRLLQAALGQLSQEHRSALELVFYQELSLAEAAEVMGCPLGTVKSRLSYAKTYLRRALAQAGMQAEDVL